MSEWTTHTPDGRPLRVRREQGAWAAQCGDGTEARSDLLDVALIEAVRADAAVVGHAPRTDYGAWVRVQADRIERDLRDQGGA
jgi:hypothetical protein